MCHARGLAQTRRRITELDPDASGSGSDGREGWSQHLRPQARLPGRRRHLSDFLFLSCPVRNVQRRLTWKAPKQQAPSDSAGPLGAGDRGNPAPPTPLATTAPPVPVLGSWPSAELRLASNVTPPHFALLIVYSTW